MMELGMGENEFVRVVGGWRVGNQFGRVGSLDICVDGVR